MFEKNLYVKL